jgi:hypothetical protein
LLQHATHTLPCILRTAEATRKGLESTAAEEDLLLKIVVVGEVRRKALLTRHWAGKGVSHSRSTIGVDFTLKILDVNGTVVRVQGTSLLPFGIITRSSAQTLRS